MSKKATSMRGEEVDFDLLDIKEKMQQKSKPLEVKTREDFVHMKRRRRGGGNIDKLLQERQSKAVDIKTPTKENKKEASVKKKKTDNKTVQNQQSSENVEPSNNEKTPESTPNRKIVKKDV